MATNAVILLATVAIATIVMAGGLGWVVVRTRDPKREAAVNRDAVETDALDIEREQSLANEFIADARSAQAATPPDLIVGSDASGNATPSSTR